MRALPMWLHTRWGLAACMESCMWLPSWERGAVITLPWRGSHLAIMEAGSKAELVISATLNCSWYAFSALHACTQLTMHAFHAGGVLSGDIMGRNTGPFLWNCKLPIATSRSADTDMQG